MQRENILWYNHTLKRMCWYLYSIILFYYLVHVQLQFKSRWKCCDLRSYYQLKTSVVEFNSNLKPIDMCNISGFSKTYCEVFSFIYFEHYSQRNFISAANSVTILTGTDLLVIDLFNIVLVRFLRRAIAHSK